MIDFFRFCYIATYATNILLLL